MADYYKAISMLEAMKQYYSDDIKSNFDQAIVALRRCENIDKAEIIRMPKIVIRDKGYGSFEYPFGTMYHDNLYTDGHYIYYRNLQNGEGSDHAFSDYEIVKTAEDGSLDTIKVIAVTPDIFPEAEPVPAGVCEICGSKNDVRDFQSSSDFIRHYICGSCVSMSEEKRKTLKKDQQSVVFFAKILFADSEE